MTIDASLGIMFAFFFVFNVLVFSAVVVVLRMH